jgi:low affinity Fe/Cu permease
MQFYSGATGHPVASARDFASGGYSRMIAAWFMTLIIQRAEHRDTQAIHAKLDELLRAEGRARSELAQLDDEEAIEAQRAQERFDRN